jgi:ABC-2 type transport system ATP-binding protein
MSGTGIELRTVSVRYGRTAALDGVDLQVPPATVYAILGKNGAGKSSLARVIAGLVLPTSGDLHIDGTSVCSPTIHRVRRSMGFLPQEPLLHEELTGREFLQFIRDLYGAGPSTEDRQRELRGRMEVGSWLDAPIRSYSNGMRKKVALLASLLPEPRFWILDEPFAALDGAGVRVLETEISCLRACGGLTLFTAHDPDIAERLADRVGVLDGGKIVFDGPVATFRALGRKLLGDGQPAASGRSWK